MVRPAYIDSNGMKKGAWSVDEDLKLRSHIDRYGHPNWRMVPILAGLARCGKSCRLRWVNYLKPGLRRGNFTREEEDQIIRLHAILGNMWSAIAAHMPGRTDNEVKNHWHAHLKKRIRLSPPEQSTEPSLSCITSLEDDHHQESDVFSTATNPQVMNLVNQIPHDYYEVDQVLTASGAANNQMYFNNNMLQCEDDNGQLIYWDMDTLPFHELLMNDCTNHYCTSYGSDATGLITSSTAESLHSEALIFGEDCQYYASCGFGDDWERRYE